jgi:hypothetical protein
MPKPQKTKTQQPKFIDPLQSQPMDLPEPQDTPAPELRKASAAKTTQATGNIQPTDRMRDLMSRMRDIEHDGEDDLDTTALSEPLKPQTLPSVISKQMIAAGVQAPDFHIVSNLPGNMQQGIRTLGRALFKSMTRTKIDDITVVANVMGQGPNTSQEINAVTQWVREHGQDRGPGNIDFDRVIPGYAAETHQYSAGGARWLLVKDEFGQYIYTWPEQESVDSTERIGAPDKRRLK